MLKDEIEKTIYSIKKGQKKYESMGLTRKTHNPSHKTMITQQKANKKTIIKLNSQSTKY